jgi:alkylhydroperoxidase/carboxymuconolactone decarboxylase family protein YurZ
MGTGDIIRYDQTLGRLAIEEEGMKTLAIDTADIAHEVSPGLAAGVRTLRAVLESDGALPASHKALFTAAAGCAQRQPELTRAALERARELGLEAPAALGTATTLMLSWGETAFRDFVAAVREVYGETPVPAPASRGDDVTASTDEALAYFHDHFGEVPPRQRLFSEIAPTAFQAYHLMHRAGLKQNVLSHQTAELLLCAVIAAALQPGLLEIHIRSALGVGATHAAVTEAVLSAVPVTGWAVWASGAAALENTRPVPDTRAQSRLPR